MRACMRRPTWLALHHSPSGIQLLFSSVHNSRAHLVCRQCISVLRDRFFGASSALQERSSHNTDSAMKAGGASRVPACQDILGWSGGPLHPPHSGNACGASLGNSSGNCANVGADSSVNVAGWISQVRHGLLCLSCCAELYSIDEQS